MQRCSDLNFSSCYFSMTELILGICFTRIIFFFNHTTVNLVILVLKRLLFIYSGIFLFHWAAVTLSLRKRIEAFQFLMRSSVWFRLCQSQLQWRLSSWDVGNFECKETTRFVNLKPHQLTIEVEYAKWSNLLGHKFVRNLWSKKENFVSCRKTIALWLSSIFALISCCLTYVLSPDTFQDNTFQHLWLTLFIKTQMHKVAAWHSMSYI